MPDEANVGGQNKLRQAYRSHAGELVSLTHLSFCCMLTSMVSDQIAPGVQVRPPLFSMDPSLMKEINGC